MPWTAARTTKMLIKAVSARHCAAASVLRNCRFSCCAEQSHEDNVRSFAVEKQLMKKKSNLCMEVGEKGDYLHIATLHHQNDSCIKMGSDESHTAPELCGIARTVMIFKYNT